MRASNVLVTRLFAIIALILSGFMLAACANAQEPMRRPIDSTPISIVDGQGDIIAKFDVEIAATDQERAAGLMFRTDLPKDRGMLFSFDDESLRFFWMKNTPTPLDIIFADENGRIVSISKNTVPFSTNALPSGLPAKYAFEIHAGLSNQYDIHKDHILIHPIIEKK